MASASPGTAAGTTIIVDEARIDNIRLLTTISKHLKIPKAGIKTTPIILSLSQAGIMGFNEDFVHMTSAHIDALTYVDPTTRAATPLAVNLKMKLRALLAFYHWVSHGKGGAVALAKIDSSNFDEFRTKACDPNEDIIPWGRMSSKSQGLQNWNRSVKPNARDFKTYRDSTTWNDWKDGFLITVQSQNLTHLIN